MATDVHTPARKGDLIAYETQTSVAYVNGPTTTSSTYRVARVLTATVGGYVRLVDDGYGRPKQFDTLRAHYRAVVTSSSVDTSSAWESVARQTFDSLAGLRAALRPFRTEI